MPRKLQPKPKCELQQIPGIGKSMSQDLLAMGYTTIESLKNQDPQAIYDRHCQIKGCHVDRCVLYAFRCAVYYASNQEHDPEKLNWWNWKDENRKTKT